MQRTPEQEAICTSVGDGDNIMVEALAGCAKSTTIIESLTEIDGKYSTAILAFNVKIKKEMEAKIKEHKLMRSNLQVLTMNGLGHRAIGEALGRRCEVDPDKIFNLSKDVGVRGDDLADLMALVRQARMSGIIPKGLPGTGLLPDEDESWEGLCDNLDVDPIFIGPARKVLLQSTKAALTGTLDYDDQIYVSSLIFGKFPRFDTVFVDEAQDLSRMNHVQLRKTAKSQIVAVGDPHQAIYAWRGADSDSMRNLRSLRETWVDRTLSVTFRCPTRIVERQKSFVPRFTAGPNNLSGHIESLKSWTPSGGARSAILCRNNAPLLGMAFRLLSRGIPVNVLGKDIGRSLKRLYKKVSKEGKLSLAQTCDELEILMEKDAEKADRYESLLVVLQSQGSVDKALAFFDTANKNAITLSTGHRAKGLEWDTVYHLEPGLIPSRYAQIAGGPALDQEHNLRYVIETRTKDKLFFVRGEGLCDAA